jgi:hypothetical protein
MWNATFIILYVVIASPVTLFQKKKLPKLVAAAFCKTASAVCIIGAIISPRDRNVWYKEDFVPAKET